MQEDASMTGVPKDFVHRRLPWVVAAVALVVYLLTLNYWPTFTGLPLLARVVGWDWHPVLYGPLFYLVSYPIRWLPDGWQLGGLSLFSAICASLTLALLARTVSLLPHDRTRDQRALEGNDYSLLSLGSAWIPPVLAALVAGLQLTFWENAAFASSEMFDLLLFAYVIRCLLEHRIDHRDSWLLKSALVYGLGMTNNVAMIGFFPVWLVALVWVKLRDFFNWKFLLQMFAIGLAGFLLVLLLPAINSLSDLVDKNFWELLKANLGYQKGVLLGVPRYLVLLISLTSLVPILFIGIRWPAHFGDISAAGNYLTRLMTHLIHIIFFGACIYVAFDPPFSPRMIAGNMFAYLPFYYLGAIVIGYCAGYVLLVFGTKPNPRSKSWQKPTPVRMALNYVLVTTVWIGLVAVPAGLVYKNLPWIRLTNSQYLSEFSKEAAKELPAKGAVVVSDDPFRLYGVQAILSRSGAEGRHIFIDSKALNSVAYHLWLQDRYPDWPKLPPEHPRKGEVDASFLIAMLAELSRTREVFYLQPTFGYYIEHFYLKPRKALYQLLQYPPNALGGPPATKAELVENAEFWRRFKTTHLDSLVKRIDLERPRITPKKKGKAKQEPNPFTFFVGGMFSRAMNHLGVEIQRSGDLAAARELFGYALDLNPDNPMAYINQDYNAVLRGEKKDAGPSEGVKQRLAPYRNDWDAILNLNGPVDEPNSGYLQAKAFSKGGNHRQAAQLMERVVALEPKNRALRLDLASGYVAAGFPEKAAKLIQELRAETQGETLGSDEEIGLAQVEAWTKVSLKDVPAAEKMLGALQQKYPLTPAPFGTLTEIYLTLGRVNDAIAILERQIKLQTNYMNAVVNLGAVLMRAGKVEQAVPHLDRALAKQPQNTAARMNRASAYLTLNNLDGAQKDYEHLALTLSKPLPAVHFGLGEVFVLKKLPKKAIEEYEKYLKIAPSNTPEAKYVQDRVKALKSGRLGVDASAPKKK